jgi:hypothetical protein
VNSLGCGITGQHTVECLERMVSGLWEEQLRMQPVIDAARQLREDRNNGLDMYDAAVAVCRAVEALNEPCCTCTERINAPGSDWDGTIMHNWECPWLQWMRTGSHKKED